MDVAFYLKWGLGDRDMGLSLDLGLGGTGFESTSWFLGDVRLSLQLFFLEGGCVFESISFWGGGVWV